MLPPLKIPYLGFFCDFWVFRNTIYNGTPLDMKDFGTHCKRGKGIGNQRVCKWINNGGFNATDLGTKMLIWLNEKNAIREKFQHKEKEHVADNIQFTNDFHDKKVKTIYFATPPIEIPFIQNISKIIESGGYHVFHQTHLRDFIKNKFRDCAEERFELQLHDFVSQTEQQLCTDAGIFLGSESSTWSGAIAKDRGARNLTKYDGSNIVFL